MMKRQSRKRKQQQEYLSLKKIKAKIHINTSTSKAKKKTCRNWYSYMYNISPERIVIKWKITWRINVTEPPPPPHYTSRIAWQHCNGQRCIKHNIGLSFQCCPTTSLFISIDKTFVISMFVFYKLLIIIANHGFKSASFLSDERGNRWESPVGYRRWFLIWYNLNIQ